MTTVNINPDVSVGSIRSYAASYPLAREGTGSKVVVTEHPTNVGQRRYTVGSQVTYEVNQYLSRFNLSYLSTNIVETATISLVNWEDASTAQPDSDSDRMFFWIEAYAVDWGTVIDAGDFLAGSSLAGRTRYARIHSGEAKARIRNGSGGAGGYYSFPDVGEPGQDGYCVISWADNREVWRYHGSFSWVCPAGVTSVLVELLGGGGGGSGSQDVDNEGGAGGGGAYAASTIATTPGTSYAIVVGEGEKGGAPAEVRAAMGPIALGLQA